MKEKVPKFSPEPNSPCRFWFKIDLEHNLPVFSENILPVILHLISMGMISIISTVVVKGLSY